MSYFASSYEAETLAGRGVTPRWFITRLKAVCDNSVCDAAHLGTSDGYGYDPAITSISTTAEGTSGVCEFPTGRVWSSGCESILFRLVIENNTTADLAVDVAFYEAMYGSSGTVEYWRHIVTRSGMTNGQVVQVPSDGGRVFAHIEAYTNPDSAANLYILARRAAHIGRYNTDGGGGDAYADEGLGGTGMHVWNATDKKWIRLVGTSTGAIVEAVQDTAADLNCTEANSTAILADTASMDTNLGTVASAVEDHDGALTDAACVKVAGDAVSGTPTSITGGDVARLATDLTRALRTYEAPATSMNTGSQQVSNAAATALNGGASLPCLRVHVQARASNTNYITVGDSGVAATDGIRLYPGDSIMLMVSDVNLVYGYAQVLNERLDWTCEIRG